MTHRLGHLVDQVVTVTGDDPLPFVALENIGSRTGNLLPDAELPVRTPEPTGMTTFRPGDVLFGKLRPYLAKSWRADRPGLCSTEFIVMRPRPEVDDRWLAYLAQSDLIVEWAEATSEGVKMPRTSWEKLRLLDIRAPSLAEQDAIADYLDGETARIDALVAARRSQMDLLKLRLRAAIDDHLDMVPEAWRLKHLLAAPLEYGASEAADDDDPAWPRYVRTTDIDDDGNLRLETFRSLPPAVAAPFLLRAGDLLLTRSGATVGKSILWREEWGRACFAGYLIRARPDMHRVAPEYLAYFVRSSRYWDEIRLTTIQATIPNVSAERYGDLRVPFPCWDDQLSIVRRLDGVSQSTRTLGQVMATQVDALLKRRQTLITAAVTGQLEIPVVAA